MNVVLIFISFLIFEIDTTEDYPEDFEKRDDYSVSEMVFRQDDFEEQELEAIELIIKEFISEKKISNEKLSLLTNEEVKKDLSKFLAEKHLAPEDFGNVEAEFLKNMITKLVPKDYFKPDDIENAKTEVLKKIVTKLVPEGPLKPDDVEHAEAEVFKDMDAEIAPEGSLKSADVSENGETEFLDDLMDPKPVPKVFLKPEDLSKNGETGYSKKKVLKLVPQGLLKPDDFENGVFSSQDGITTLDDDLFKMQADVSGTTEKEIIALKNIVIKFMAKKRWRIEDIDHYDLDELKNYISEISSEKRLKNLETTNINPEILHKIVEKLKTGGIIIQEDSFRQESSESQDSVSESEAFTSEDDYESTNLKFKKLKNIVIQFLTEKNIRIEDILPLDLNDFKKEISLFISKKQIKNQEITKVESGILKKIVKELELGNNFLQNSSESEERDFGRVINTLEDDGSSIDQEIEALKFKTVKTAQKSLSTKKDSFRQDSKKSHNDRAKTKIYSLANNGRSTNQEAEIFKKKTSKTVPKSLSGQELKDFEYNTDGYTFHIQEDEVGSPIQDIVILKDQEDEPETEKLIKDKNYFEHDFKDLHQKTNKLNNYPQADEGGFTNQEIEKIKIKTFEILSESSSEGNDFFSEESKDNSSQESTNHSNLELYNFSDQGFDDLSSLNLTDVSSLESKDFSIQDFREVSNLEFEGFSNQDLRDFQHKKDDSTFHIQADEGGSTIQEIEILNDQGDELETEEVMRNHNYSEQDSRDLRHKTNELKIYPQSNNHKSKNEKIGTLNSIVSDFINENKFRTKNLAQFDLEVFKNLLIKYITEKQIKNENITEIDSFFLKNIINIILPERILKNEDLSRNDSQDFQKKTALPDINIQPDTKNHMLFNKEDSLLRHKDFKSSELNVVSQKTPKMIETFGIENHYRDRHFENIGNKKEQSFKDDKNKSNAFVYDTQMGDEFKALVSKKMYSESRIPKYVSSIPELSDSKQYEYTPTYTQKHNFIGHKDFDVKENANPKTLKEDSVLNNQNEMLSGNSNTQISLNPLFTDDNSRDSASKDLNKNFQSDSQQYISLERVNKLYVDKPFNRIALTFLASKKQPI